MNRTRLHTIALARRMGLTNAQIGASLGISRQAVSASMLRNGLSEEPEAIPAGLPALFLASLASEWLADALALDAEQSTAMPAEPESSPFHVPTKDAMSWFGCCPDEDDALALDAESKPAMTLEPEAEHGDL